MVNQDKITKTVKEYSKGGLTAGIAIYFLMQMNTKMDAQANEIKEIQKNQAEVRTMVLQLRGETTGLWEKYNEAMKGKEALSKEGSRAYLELIERINKLENR